jgi:quercetin dioxygenase-like cupin family protein
MYQKIAGKTEKFNMGYPDTKITAAGNLWVRQMHFNKAGDKNEGHEHNYDHLTLLAHGSVRVHVDEHTTDFKAPQMIFIKAGKRHFIESLEDGVIAYCVHALRNKDAEDSEILDPSQIPTGVHPQLLAKAL